VLLFGLLQTFDLGELAVKTLKILKCFFEGWEGTLLGTNEGYLYVWRTCT